MDPIEHLNRDHHLILGVLDALEAWLADVQRRNNDARAELCRFLVFFHRFVDGVHHVEEEDVLFRALVDRHPEACKRLVAALLDGHEQGRELLAPIEDLAYQPSAWTAEHRAALGRAIAAYVAQQREHVATEARELVPLLRTRIDDAAQRSIAGDLRRFDADRAESADRLRELAETLIEARGIHCEHLYRSAPTHAPSGPVRDLIHAGAACDAEGTDECANDLDYGHSADVP